jgi:spermidine/putrescine transport system ATP-binding protein
MTDEPQEVAVRLNGLRKTYGDVVAVERVDVDIANREFFSMIGPSGCGKTTTLRMIAGLVDPTEGTIEVGGRDVTSLRPHQRPVNTVFQQYALFPHMTIFENVAFGLRERRVGRAEIATRVGEMLELVDLKGRDKAKPAQLSGGQQQRVALARSLVLNPEVLLLDEPLGALDLKLRKQLQLQLKRIQHEVGITFVYVTHDQEEAFSMSDRVAIMHGGRMDQLGTPREVYQRPATEFVADFVGASNRRVGTVVAPAAGGGYEVELAGIGNVPAAGVDGLSPGQRIAAIIRPEAVRLCEPAFDGVRLPATVIDVAYLGPQVSCVVEAGGGQLVTMTGPADQRLAIGDDCEVGWPHSAMWVLPLDPEAAVEAADPDAAPVSAA